MILFSGSEVFDFGLDSLYQQFQSEFEQMINKVEGMELSPPTLFSIKALLCAMIALVGTLTFLPTFRLVTCHQFIIKYGTPGLEKAGFKDLGIALMSYVNILSSFVLVALWTKPLQEALLSGQNPYVSSQCCSY